MTDTLAIGAAWRRMVTIADETGNPIDPTGLTAELSPATPITLTQVGPGTYEMLLTDAETAALTPGSRVWEMWGRIGPDLTRITAQYLQVFKGYGP